jgi:hypothetical protein
MFLWLLGQKSHKFKANHLYRSTQKVPSETAMHNKKRASAVGISNLQ